MRQKVSHTATSCPISKKISPNPRFLLDRLPCGNYYPCQSKLPCGNRDKERQSRQPSKGVRHLSKINQILGAWLLQKGHTREQLATAAGVSVAALNDKIAGTTKWKWDEVCDIADFISIPIQDFREKDAE